MIELGREEKVMAQEVAARQDTTSETTRKS